LIGSYKIKENTTLDWATSFNTIKSDMPDRTQNTLKFLDASNGFVIAQNTITDNHRYNQNLVEDEFAANLVLNHKLENGKIITMLHEDSEVCGNLFKNEEDKKNVRLLEGNFYFLKNSIEDLKKYPISMMRVVYGAETVDYVIRKELDSELLKQFFRPESFFINYLHCIEN
jgi:hypothetical protein